MTTRHLVDPEILPVLDLLPQLSLSSDTLAERRAGFAAFVQPVESYARSDVAIEHRHIPGPAGAPDVAVIVYRPVVATSPLPVFLHIHGGGYVLGAAEMSGPANVRTAAELNCVVVSVDYRLAPETPAPGAVEDCYAALRWLAGNAAALGIDPTRIAIGGESAGGGHAATLAQLARDRGEVTLCFQMLIYPMIDDRTAARTDGNPHVGEFVWTRDANAFGWESLLGQPAGGATVPAYAVAARCTDLAGLPSAYIVVGALDLFLDEDIAYAQALLRAGVPTELHVVPGAFHAFEIAAWSAIAQAAESERRTALARAFAAR